MFLATTLPIGDLASLMMVVRLYSKRWTIETFFLTFKQSLRVGEFRVFSCWDAIDRLLTMAHMAFLALSLLYVMVQSNPAELKLMRLKLKLWFARPPMFTLGRFLELIAMDFAQSFWAGAVA